MPGRLQLIPLIKSDLPIRSRVPNARAAHYLGVVPPITHKEPTHRETHPTLAIKSALKKIQIDINF